MKIKQLLLLAVVFVPAVACSSTPDMGPDDAADAVAKLLVERKSEEANDLFEAVEDSGEHRNAIYATVYERAGNYYRKNRYEPTATMLRFLHENYPNASAPRVALLWTLFQRRAAVTDKPSDKEIKEWKTLVKEIRKADEKNYSAYVDLASAQVAVDEGRLDDAEREFTRFRSRWNGRPTEIRFYVEEFDRYFQSKES